MQRVNEVAAVFSATTDGHIPGLYVTIRNKDKRVLRSISSMDLNVEPMVYFYPHGSQGWHKNIMKTKNCNLNVEAGDANNDQYERHDRSVTRCSYIKFG